MKRDLPPLPLVPGLAPGSPAPAVPSGMPDVPIEAMLDAVLLVSGDGRIVAANGAACRLLAGSPAELCAHGILRFSTAPEDRFFWAEAAAGIADGLDSESHVTTFAGRQVPVVRRVAQLAAGDRGATHVVVLRDRSAEVRAERRLEAARADLAATLESTCDGLLVTDLGGRIRHFNRRFAALWRVPTELLVARDDDAVHEWMRRSVDDPVVYMRRLAQIDASMLHEPRDLLHLRDGSTLERVATLQRLQDRPIGHVFSFREVARAIDAASGADALDPAREPERLPA